MNMIYYFEVYTERFYLVVYHYYFRFTEGLGSLCYEKITSNNLVSSRYTLYKGHYELHIYHLRKIDCNTT